jgi:hypothetical protein
MSRDDEHSESLIHPSREGSPWEDWELILLLAACPRNNQNYDSRRGWVVELADLVGRSSASVSMHLGNVWSLKNGRGLTHSSDRLGEIYRRFHGQELDLLRAAATIRVGLYELAPSPRIELALPVTLEVIPEDIEERRDAEMALPQSDVELAVQGLLRETQARFPDPELAENSTVPYRRYGSLACGLLILVQLAIAYPEETRQLVEQVRRLFGHRAEVSKSAQDLIDGNKVAFADQAILDRLPGFHLHHLTGEDRVTLSSRLALLRSMRNWRPSAARLELYSTESADIERRSIGGYLGIDATRLCNRCTIMLEVLVQDGKARHVF